MGTNYDARIIPPIEQKEQLIKAIQDDDFDKVKELAKTMYGSTEMDFNTDGIIGGEVHLGKRSGGWKFLWNPNIYIRRKYEQEDGRYVFCGYEGHYLYPLTKEGIKAFIDREDVVIYDEYGEQQEKEEFYEMAINWNTWKDKEGKEVPAYDSASYHDKYPGGRIYTCDNELVKYLIQEGVKFISKGRSDFYSDGLRFATTTEFS
jgi:hypothetical protein